MLEKKQEAMLISEIGFTKFKKDTIIGNCEDECSNLYFISKGTIACELESGSPKNVQPGINDAAIPYLKMLILRKRESHTSKMGPSNRVSSLLNWEDNESVLKVYK